MEGLASSRGGRLPIFPCVRFCIAGGAALYCPLCSVLYNLGGWLSTVPCARLYIEVSMAFGGGNGVRSLPPCREGRGIIRRELSKE